MSNLLAVVVRLLSLAFPPAVVSIAALAGSLEFRDCANCPEMVVIPVGTFIMGSPPTENGRFDREGPQHQVTITRAFAVGKYEVTRGEFAAFATATGYKAGDRCGVNTDPSNREQVPGRDWQIPGFRQTDRDPAVCISWDDATAYAAWLSRMSGHSYRLLSEAEWEYVARAGTTTVRYWGEGSDEACSYANVHDATGRQINVSTWQAHACDDGYAHTAPAGSFRPNAFGVYDMLGNVYEWVGDCWNEDYSGAPNDARERTNGDCSRRVSRGGAWNSEPAVVRSAARFATPSGTHSDDVGFRIARDM